MSEDSSNNRANISAIGRVVDKLQPKIICAIIIFGVSLISAILGIAVYKGQPVSFFGIINIGAAPRNIPPIPPKEEHPGSVASISAFELTTLSAKYFDAKSDKRQLLDNIRQLILKAEDVDNLESNFFFKLLKLELIIPKFGSYIDTKINDKDRVDVYKRIQSILKEIGYFDGEIIGDQSSTYNALLIFQKAYNQKARKTIFDQTDYGKFGYRTLEAIRGWYRQVEQIQESQSK